MTIYELTLNGKTIAGPREMKAKDVTPWKARLAKIKGVHPSQIVVTKPDDGVETILLEDASRAELVEIATRFEVDFPSKATKAELIEAIRSV